MAIRLTCTAVFHTNITLHIILNDYPTEFEIHIVSPPDLLPLRRTCDSSRCRGCCDFRYWAYASYSVQFDNTIIILFGKSTGAQVQDRLAYLCQGSLQEEWLSQTSYDTWQLHTDFQKSYKVKNKVSPDQEVTFRSPGQEPAPPDWWSRLPILSNDENYIFLMLVTKHPSRLISFPSFYYFTLSADHNDRLTKFLLKEVSANNIRVSKVSKVLHITVSAVNWMCSSESDPGCKSSVTLLSGTFRITRCAPAEFYFPRVLFSQSFQIHGDYW